MKNRIERLENDITYIIKNVCNILGCKDCAEKNENGCSVTDLQNELFKETSMSANLHEKKQEKSKKRNLMQY